MAVDDFCVFLRNKDCVGNTRMREQEGVGGAWVKLEKKSFWCDARSSQILKL